MRKDELIIVTGVKGQLGFDCVRTLTERGYTNVLGIDIEDLDITNEEAVNEFICSRKPSVVMHNAAWTAVDKAEEFKEKVHQVNVLGPRYIAQACKKVGAKMFYISTDYVFEGNGTRPYLEFDTPNPVSAYGRTKLAGENFVKEFADKYFILRTAWLYGDGKNFVKTMLRLAETHDEVSVVCDQKGSPTSAVELAKMIHFLEPTDSYGLYHATCEGDTNWADFTETIF